MVCLKRKKPKRSCFALCYGKQGPRASLRSPTAKKMEEEVVLVCLKRKKYIRPKQRRCGLYYGKKSPRASLRSPTAKKMEKKKKKKAPPLRRGVAAGSGGTQALSTPEACL